MSKKLLGSSIDDSLKEEGIFEESQTQSITEVIAWQPAHAMKQKNISKAQMAARCLDEDNTAFFARVADWYNCGIRRH